MEPEALCLCCPAEESRALLGFVTHLKGERALGCSSAVERLLSKCEALSSIPIPSPKADGGVHEGKRAKDRDNGGLSDSCPWP